MRESIEKPAPKRASAKKAGRDEATFCPIAATVSVLGDRWSILVLRDLLLGLRRFDELVKSLGIATNILTDRLNKMSAEGLVSRRAYQSNPPRYEYEPTEAGQEFRKVIFSMAEWGKAWRMEPSGRAPMQYVNDQTGNPVTMQLIDVETRVETSFCETSGVLTEWADEMAEWRMETAKAHCTNGQDDDT